MASNPLKRKIEKIKRAVVGAMEESELTRMKAKYYIDTLWPEEMEKAAKIQLPKKFSRWFNQKVIVRRGQGNTIDVSTLSGFEDYLKLNPPLLMNLTSFQGGLVDRFFKQR